MMVTESTIGMRRSTISRTLLHLKVFTTTTSRIPVRAANGITSMKWYATSTKTRTEIPATIEDMRPRAPVLTLIMLWPIIAQPPMAMKKELMELPRPWDTHTWFFIAVELRSSTSSSTARHVSTDSTSPMKQSEIAIGRHRVHELLHRAAREHRLHQPNEAERDRHRQAQGPRLRVEPRHIRDVERRRDTRDGADIADERRGHQVGPKDVPLDGHREQRADQRRRKERCRREFDLATLDRLLDFRQELRDGRNEQDVKDHEPRLWVGECVELLAVGAAEVNRRAMHRVVGCEAAVARALNLETIHLRHADDDGQAVEEADESRLRDHLDQIRDLQRTAQHLQHTAQEHREERVLAALVHAQVPERAVVGHLVANHRHEGPRAAGYHRRAAERIGDHAHEEASVEPLEWVHMCNEREGDALRNFEDRDGKAGEQLVLDAYGVTVERNRFFDDGLLGFVVVDGVHALLLGRHVLAHPAEDPKKGQRAT